MKREVKTIVQLQSGTFNVRSVKIEEVTIPDKDNQKKKSISDKLVLTGKLKEEIEKLGEENTKEFSISGTTDGGLWLPTAKGKVKDPDNPSVTSASSVGKLMKIAGIRDYDDETYNEFVNKDLPVMRDATGKYLVFNVVGVK